MTPIIQFNHGLLPPRGRIRRLGRRWCKLPSETNRIRIIVLLNLSVLKSLWIALLKLNHSVSVLAYLPICLLNIEEEVNQITMHFNEALTNLIPRFQN